MAEFVVPINTEDLELKKNDRFCVEQVLDVDEGATDVDAVLDGASKVSGAVCAHACVRWRAGPK